MRRLGQYSLAFDLGLIAGLALALAWRDARGKETVPGPPGPTGPMGMKGEPGLAGCLHRYFDTDTPIPFTINNSGDQQ